MQTCADCANISVAEGGSIFFNRKKMPSTASPIFFLGLTPINSLYFF